MQDLFLRPPDKALAGLQAMLESTSNNKTGHADINATFSGRRTALHYFAQGPDAPKIIELLVAHGADVNAKDWNGYTPLHCAASKGRKANLTALINCGAQVNTKSLSGETPLHTAIAFGHDPTAYLLIKEGAALGSCEVSNGTESDGTEEECFATDSMGFTPLCVAQMCGRRELSAFIKRYLTLSAIAQFESRGGVVKGRSSPLVYDEDRALCDGATCLQRAALDGNLAEVMQLLAGSCERIPHDIMSISERHSAPPRVRVRRDINARNLHGRTAMHAAAFAGDVDIIRVLAEAGANVNAKDKRGLRPIDLALREYRDDAAALLVELGSTVWLGEEMRCEEARAFHRSGNFGGRGGSAAGVEPPKIPSSKLTMHYAASFGLEKTLLALLNRPELPSLGAEGTTGMVSATPQEDNLLMIATEKERWTPLHYASARGHLGCVQHLVYRGADMALTDVYGRTPLMCAVAFQRTDVVAFLNNL